MFVREHALYYGTGAKSGYTLYTRTDGVYVIIDKMQSCESTFNKISCQQHFYLKSSINFLYDS
jgi:hypothetical protein